MDKAIFRGLFLDDRQDQANLAAFLSVKERGGLSTEFQPVDRSLEEMAGKVLEYSPDILALDYRLDDTQTSGEVGVRYKAGPLAQQLRDHASDSEADDFPIVLVSQENIIRNQYGPDLTTHDLFDRIYAKEDLVTRQQQIGAELLALVEGYKAIISNWGNEIRLTHLLGLADDDQAQSLLGNQDLRLWQQLTAPHQLARKILRNIIDRNGLLLDQPSLLARLGIAKDSPDIETLIGILEKSDATYLGVFNGGWRRWWSHGVDAFGERTCGNDLGNLTAKERVECLNHQFDLSLVAAKSRWTGSNEIFTSFACASCSHPTEKIHSVAAFDHAPSFAERKRICWYCIATGEYENTKLSIEDAETYIVEKIKNGEITGEA